MPAFGIRVGATTSPNTWHLACAHAVLLPLQVAVQWLAEEGIAAVDLADGLSACERVQTSAFPKY
jgi:hypothetical protein